MLQGIQPCVAKLKSSKVCTPHLLPASLLSLLKPIIQSGNLASLILLVLRPSAHPAFVQHKAVVLSQCRQHCCGRVPNIPLCVEASRCSPAGLIQSRIAWQHLAAILACSAFCCTDLLHSLACSCRQPCNQRAHTHTHLRLNAHNVSCQEACNPALWTCLATENMV